MSTNPATPQSVLTGTEAYIVAQAAELQTISTALNHVESHVTGGVLSSIKNAIAALKNAQAARASILAGVQATLTLLDTPTPGPTPSPPSPPPPSGTPVPVGNVPGTWADLVLDEQWASGGLNSNWQSHNGWKGQNGVTDNDNYLSIPAGGPAVLSLNGATGAAIQTVSPLVKPGYYVEALATFWAGWNAIWLCTTDAYPTSEYEEIDFGEALGGKVTCTTHWGNGQESPSFPLPGNLIGSQHTFGVLWSADGKTATYYVDGQEAHQESLVPSGDPMFIILTSGQGSGNPQGSGKALEVSYVRVWAG